LATPHHPNLPPIVIRDQVGVCGVRDDSRVLAEIAADAPAPGRGLDLGTGTGYVGLVLAQRGWQVDAVDVSPRAVELARANAAANGLEMATYVANLFDSVPGAFDVIAFNPPMRPDETEISRMVTSVLRRSPRLSHFLMQVGGGRLESNRTSFLRDVVAESRRRLTPTGRLILAINVQEILEIATWPGVRLLRKIPLPGMEPQEVAEFRFEETP
jgi:release factor glutamine methyltransferase